MQLFNSRDERYRAPFGAVAEDTTVLFRVCLPRAFRCHAAWLVRCEDNGMLQWDSMFWAGIENDCEWWDCRYTPEKAGLYWYGFAIDTEHGRRFLTRQADGTAGLSNTEGPLWQLTCFENTFETPDWLAGGVMYQVFPDRFAKSNMVKTDVPSDRIIRDVWGEQPHWQPDAAGIVHNNDFFGGDLRGIRERLPYLKSLGVTCVYLNPIFESHSNHRYDTADYAHIDPMLGDEREFRELTNAAKALGIRVILDGVFSHTGADSIYFNKNGRYNTVGAYQSPESVYAGWYRFSHWPDDYAGWWGFPTLPEVDELNEAFLEYITGEGGIVEKWLDAGASGWRLDVADELPDGFLDALRHRVKTTNHDALVLGEVWEDASNKQSYGHRRRYLLGKQLDSVMNYPFRQAILDVVRDGNTGKFFETVCGIVENYPPQVTRILMNSLGTHDTERALTLLGGEAANGRGRSWQSQTTMTAAQRAHACRLLRMAAVLQYCLPGVPCIYYGDEAGMEGYRDPFNRGCYPWGDEDMALVDWFRQLGVIRADNGVFAQGGFQPMSAEEGVVLFRRHDDSGVVVCAVNCRDREVRVPFVSGFDVAIGDAAVCDDTLILPPFTGSVLIAKKV